VTLYYLEPHDSGYVMVHGLAQLVNDTKEKDARWKTAWEAFYPNKEDDYLLIKIIPQWLEVISYSHGIIGDHETWEPPKVLFD
jgi:general stress protein 26